MNTTTVTMTEGDGRILVTSAYHPDLPARAKKLGGKFSKNLCGGTWSFDARDKERVCALYRDIYGTDGSTPEEVLTIRTTPAVCDHKITSYWLAGREIAHVAGRDSGARLGTGVVILTGGFFSGGSVKNPKILAKEGTTFELRDVPATKAREIHEGYYDVAILDASGEVVEAATHKEPEPPPIDAERADVDAAIQYAEFEMAALQGRLAGLQFRKAELARFSLG